MFCPQYSMFLQFYVFKLEGIKSLKATFDKQIIVILLLHDPIYFKEKNINLDMQKDFAKVIICFLLQSSKRFSVIYSLNKYFLNVYTMRSSPPQQHP